MREIFQSGYIRYNELQTTLQHKIPYYSDIVCIDSDDTNWQTTDNGLYSIDIDLSLTIIPKHFSIRDNYIIVNMFSVSNKSGYETNTTTNENVIFSYEVKNDGKTITITIDEIDNYKIIIDVYQKI